MPVSIAAKVLLEGELEFSGETSEVVFDSAEVTIDTQSGVNLRLPSSASATAGAGATAGLTYFIPFSAVLMHAQSTSPEQGKPFVYLHLDAGALTLPGELRPQGSAPAGAAKPEEAAERLKISEVQIFPHPPANVPFLWEMLCEGVTISCEKAASAPSGHSDDEGENDGEGDDEIPQWAVQLAKAIEAEPGTHSNDGDQAQGAEGDAEVGSRKRTRRDK
jgi:hypothetical protein